MEEPRVAPSTTASSRGGVAALRFLAGVLLAGYGALVVLGLLAHESPLVGALMVLAGGALLWTARPARGARPHAPAAPRAPARSGATAALGAAAAGGVVAYNLLARSDLSPPELAILAYGLALLAAARRLDRRVLGTDVGTAVAWSLPLVAAPLGLYALDAALDAGVGSSPLDAFIAHGLVRPMAWTLDALGFETATYGQTVLLSTPRGRLALGIGLVCAGLHPSILFLGAFGLFAWQERTPPLRLAALLALGLVGVYVANLLRLVLLALVGYRWGGAALQTAHAHAGWIIFVAWMLAYWWIVLRHLQGGPPRDAGPA